MRHVICVTVLLCGALGCDNSNSPNTKPTQEQPTDNPNTQKNSKDNAQPTSKSNDPEDDSKIALAKFKKIIECLSEDILISPKNVQTESNIFVEYENVKSSRYDVIPSSSLLSGYTGKYYQTRTYKRVDKEPDMLVYMTPVTEFLTENEYIFAFNKESKRWEFDRRKSTGTRLTEKRIGNKIIDYAGTKNSSDFTISDFNPKWREAIEKCVNAQDK
jgi:hypothetical protein